MNLNHPRHQVGLFISMGIASPLLLMVPVAIEEGLRGNYGTSSALFLASAGLYALAAIAAIKLGEANARAMKRDN